MRDGIHLSEAITGDGDRIFRHACGLGLEGIVSKRIGSRYVSGRTRAWLKTKNPDFERRSLSGQGERNIPAGKPNPQVACRWCMGLGSNGMKGASQAVRHLPIMARRHNPTGSGRAM